jgi:hypothetical protein
MTGHIAPSHSARTHLSKATLPLSVISALLVLAGGLLHLKIWDHSYRDIPTALDGAWVVKIGFPVNAAIALVLAIGLVVARDQLLVVVAALLFTAGSLAALFLSRSSFGIFGWKESGWHGDPRTVAIVEVAALVCLGALLTVRRRVR